MVDRIALVILFALFFSAGALTPFSNNILKQFPFFHSTESISNVLDELEKSCKLKMERKSIFLNTHYNMDIVTLTKGNPKLLTVDPLRMFILAGEHARELISAESALHFIKHLCSEKNLPLSQDCEAPPSSFIIRVIPNANPTGRRKVEEGQYCVRTNERGVDLNRNWDDHWTGISENGPDTYPGRKPFSEIETRTIRDQLVEFRPHIFLSIHSGNCLYMTPFAFALKEPRKSLSSKWTSVLKSLSQMDGCSIGPASRLVGYRSFGTCLDWSFEKLETPYPFAFEIYQLPSVGPGFLRRHRKHALEPLQYQIDHWRDHHPSISDDPESMLQNQNFDKKDMNELCLQIFNPSNIESYNATIKHWNNNYLCLLGAVAAAEKRKQ